MVKKLKKNIEVKNDDVMNYSSTKSLETLCSADDIISRMKYDNTLIFNDLRKGIISTDKYLPVDPFCLSKMGWGERPYVNKNSCIGCEMLRRISPSIRVPEDRIINIEVGKFEGNSYKVTEVSEEISSYETDETVKLLYQHNLRNEIDKGLKNSLILNYIDKINVLKTSSKVTNYIITSLFLNSKMSKYKIPNTTPFVWAYSCENKVKLFENKLLTYMDMNGEFTYSNTNKTITANIKAEPLQENIVIGILKQLACIFHFNSRYEFVHGSPSIHYIKFSNKNCHYKYENVIISSPVTLHISPSVNCSFEFENDNGHLNRFTSASKVYTSDIETPFPIIEADVIISPSNTKCINSSINVPFLEDITKNLVYCYKVGDYLPKLKTFHQQYGVSVLNSFETYAFLVALICEDSFYTTFCQNETLMSIWYSLWKISEYEEMMNHLDNLRKLDSIRYKEISSFLSNYTLRSDVIDHLWNCISKL